MCKLKIKSKLFGPFLGSLNEHFKIYERIASLSLWD